MDEPSGLTATEAASRSALLTVERYRVELDLTGLGGDETFESRTTITFGCDDPGATSWADLVAESTTLVELNGVTLDPAEFVAGGRIRLPDLRETNRLVVAARHRQSGRNHGLRRSVDPSDGAVYAWTHFEPFHARRVFACFDQPDLKAEYDVTVRAPMAWTCVANGRADSVHEDDDCRVWRFGTTPRLPTYVIAVCAGPYHRITTTRGGVDLGVYARHSLRDQLERQADSVMDVAARALEHFGEAYGIAYPADKLDQVYVPDFPSAMENFGCITYGDAGLFRDEPTSAQLQRRGQVQLHEIAHMWFGDLVTMPWWDGLWLKEAFATMAASMAAPTVLGRADVWATFALGAEAGAIAADQSPATHPVQVPVPDIAAAETVFDAITYNKGLAVLRQLVAVIGEEAFLQGMRSYFGRYAGGTADLDALVAELEAASGRDLRGWTDAWVHRPGPDTLTLRVTERGTAGQRVRVTVSATNGDAPRGHRVAVGHYRRGPDGHLAQIARAEVDTFDGAAEVPLPDALGDDDLLLLNDDDLTYAKVRLDEVSLRVLLGSGHTLPTALSRTVGLQLVGDLLADGGLPARDAVPAAFAALRSERDASLLSALLATAREMIRYHAPDHEVPELEAELADACLEAMDDAPDTSQRLSLALGVASCATTPEQHSAVDRLLANDPLRRRDLRWAALVRKVATDEADDAAVADELSRDPDPDASARAAAARAARGTASAKDGAIRALFDDRAVSVSALADYGDAIWQRHQGELLRPFAVAFVDRLRDGGSALAPETVARMVTFAFPRAGIDRALLDRADEVALDPTTPPLVAKRLRVQTHKLRGALIGRRA